MSQKKAVCESRSFQQQTHGKPALRDDIQIAVQIHIYYTDLIPELVAALKNICHPFDLYITTDTQEKAELIQKQFDLTENPDIYAKKVQVDVCGNRGRDVVPFLKQLCPVYRQYQYFCHLHTKKSKHSDVGDAWRRYLYNGLMGSRTIVDNVLQLFETDPSVGVVYPENFPLLAPCMNWGANKKICHEAARAAGVEILPFKAKGKETVLFPAGDMFWARTEAVHQLLRCPFADEAVPPEEGQLDGTIMHAIERLWTYTAKFNGYRTVLMETDYTEECMIRELERREKGIVNKLLPYGTRRRAFVRWLTSPFKK